MENRWSDPRIDLSPFVEMFDMPPIPIWVEELAPGVLGSFHRPGCECGRPYGISIDVPKLERQGRDPNTTILHEAVHALHFHLDPEGYTRDDIQNALDGMEFGEDWAYINSPLEQIARFGAEYLDRIGMRVWNPGRTR